MNIGLVIPSMDKGGLEQVVLELYRSYRHVGANVTIFLEASTHGYLSLEVDDRHDVVLLNGDENYFIATCFKRKISVLHYHYSTFNICAMTQLGFVTVYTIHNVYTWLNDGDFAARLDLVAGATEVTGVSKFVADYAVERYGESMKRVVAIGNGANWTPDEVSSAIRRCDFGLRDGPPIVCVI